MRESAKKFLKKVEKTFKKCLTNEKQCDIIVERRKERSKNRSLKIEQQEESTSIEHGNMVCARTELEDSERNTTQTKSKEQSSSD